MDGSIAQLSIEIGEAVGAVISYQQFPLEEGCNNFEMPFEIDDPAEGESLKAIEFRIDKLAGPKLSFLRVTTLRFRYTKTIQ